MDTRASRYAMWRLHAPPSREADINPNPKKGGYPAPDRVTFLTGANRDSLIGGDIRHPKWLVPAARYTRDLRAIRFRRRTIQFYDGRAIDLCELIRALYLVRMRSEETK